MSNRDFDSQVIAIEAASWVLQLDKGALSKEDQKVLKEWVNRSPAHARALSEYTSMWISIDDIMVDAIDKDEAYKKSTKSSLIPTLFPNLSLGKILFGWAPALAMVVAVVAMAPTYLAAPSPTAVEVTPVIYSTKLGEQAEFKLTDGSMVHLNTNSRVEVSYHTNRRLLRLVKGEAHFDVAPDKKRPFDVIAGKKKISALGTAFVIRLTDTGLDVTVTKGIVGIASASAPASAQLKKSPDSQYQAILEPNQHLLVEKDTTVVAKVESPVMDRQFSWREGLLKFEDDTLSYVIDEVSRYTHTKIIIGDKDLKKLRIGGLFKTGEVKPLMNALKLSFDIHVDYVDSSTIYLTPRSSSETNS